MNTSVIENYVFDKAAKTIIFSDFTTIDLSRIISIVDSTNGVQVYSYNNSSYTGTVAANVLTLGYDVNNARFSNSDKLNIEYVTDNYGVIVANLSGITTTGNTPTITNYSKGAIFTINVSAVSGTPTMVLKLQMLDIASGTWVDVAGAALAEITTTGIKVLTVYPGVTVAANSAISTPLPRKYRFAYTIGGEAPSLTFSITANYIN